MIAAKQRTYDRWSEQQNFKLREMIKDGKSSGQIALEIGKSRNAVIGRAHRLGLKLGAERVLKNRVIKARITAPRDHKNHNSGTKSASAVYRAAPQRCADQKPEKIDRRHNGRAFDIANAPPAARALNLLELGIGQCKWPLFTNGARLFCAADTAAATGDVMHEDEKPNHGTYCKFHADMSRNSNQKGNGM